MIRSIGMVVATVALTASCGGQVPADTRSQSTPTPPSVVRDPIDGVVTHRQSERLGVSVGDGLCSLNAVSQQLNRKGLTLRRLQAGFLTDEPGVTQWAAEMFGAWSDVSGRPLGQIHALCWFETEGALDALNDGTVAPARFVVVDTTVAAPFAASVLVSSPDPIAVVLSRAKVAGLRTAFLVE